MSAMSTRDYERWHAHYDDPDSPLSWRLGVVRVSIDSFLDHRPGQVRVVSVCAGDGRDLIGVLAQRTDAERVQTTLLEIHPVVAARARASAEAAGLDVEVHEADAGSSDAYLDIEPADLVLLVGIFGNISDADIFRTITSSRQLCRPGATLVWSRGREAEKFGDRNPEIRSAFSAAAFIEVDYLTLDEGSLPSIGVERYDGPAIPLVPGRRWFTFIR